MKDIKEIVRLAFDQEAAHANVIDDLENETWYSHDHWIVAELDGKVVSALGMRPGVMWISSVAVPVVTIGTVSTLPDKRGQGIGLDLMAFADKLMPEGGVVLSRLHTWAGRFAFYGRCGYVKAVNNQPVSAFDVDLIKPETKKKAEEALGDAVVRPAHPRDAARMLEIYEATFSRATGHLSRNEHFVLRRIGRHPKLWNWSAPRFDVVEDPADGVVGYVGYLLENSGQKKQGSIEELATLGHHAGIARTLVLHVAREAQRLGILKLDAYVDPHEPLGWVVSEFRMNVEPESFVSFLKVQDDRRFVELVKPIVETRAKRFEVRLTINLAGMGDITVGDGQDVRIVTDVPHFATLVYNGAWLAGLMGQGALFIEPETTWADHAVQSVFPDTHARRSKLDAY